MASNTRGKLKEEFEGIHRNFDWIIFHCQKSVMLIRGHNPDLTDAVTGLGETVQELDELARDIYKKL